MTRSEVARLVAMLMQAYPQSQFGPASSELYETMLSDIDGAVALAAVKRLVQTTRWLPTVSEIRAAAADVLHGPRRTGAEAWGDVVAAIQRVGSYRPAPEFTDAVVANAVSQMGWRNLCLSDNDASDRARFIDLYDALSQRARTAVVTAKALAPTASIAALPPWREEARTKTRVLAAPRLRPTVTTAQLDRSLLQIGKKP